MYRSVLIVGCGRVGRAVGLLLALKSGWQILFYDRRIEVARAVAEDTMHAIAALGVDSYVEWVSEPTSADIVIVTADVAGGAKPGVKRLELLQANLEVARFVAERVYPKAEKAWYVVVTNPVEAIAYAIAMLTEHDKVIATSTLIDSARLRWFLANRLQVRLSDVEAMMGGIHGDEPVILWSTVRVKGERLKPTKKLEEEALEYVVKTPHEIVSILGMTIHGAASMITALVEALVGSRHQLLPAALCGSDSLCVGAPLVVGYWRAEEALWLLEAEERRILEEKSVKIRRLVEENIEGRSTPAH